MQDGPAFSHLGLRIVEFPPQSPPPHFAVQNQYGYSLGLTQTLIAAQLLLAHYHQQRMEELEPLMNAVSQAGLSKLQPITCCYICNDQALFQLEFRTGSRFVCIDCGMTYCMLFEGESWRETVYTDALLVAEKLARVTVHTARLLPELTRPDIAEIDKPNVTYDDAMDYIYRFSAKSSMRERMSLTQTAIFAQTFPDADSSQSQKPRTFAPQKPQKRGSAQKLDMSLLDSMFDGLKK